MSSRLLEAQKGLAIRMTARPAHLGGPGWDAHVSAVHAGINHTEQGTDWQDVFNAASAYALEELEKLGREGVGHATGISQPEIVFVTRIEWDPDPSTVVGKACTLKLSKIMILNPETEDGTEVEFE